MNDLSSLLDQSSYLRLMSDNNIQGERATSNFGMSTQKTYNASDYVSCIRINGRPILPPVMTPGRRLECLEWKRKALEVEEKLGEKRRQKILDTIKSLKTSTSSASAPPSIRPSSAPFANPYTEYDDGDEDNGKNTEKESKSLPKLSDEELNVEYTYEKPLVGNEISVVKYINEDQNILNVSTMEESVGHYDSANTASSETNIKRTDKTGEILDKSCQHDGYFTDQAVSYESPEEEIQPNTIQTNIGRRERRGSYTLDEPSPLLVAYMERFGQNFSDNSNAYNTSKYFKPIRSSI